MPKDEQKESSTKKNATTFFGALIGAAATVPN